MNSTDFKVKHSQFHHSVGFWIKGIPKSFNQLVIFTNSDITLHLCLTFLPGASTPAKFICFGWATFTKSATLHEESIPEGIWGAECRAQAMQRMHAPPAILSWGFFLCNLKYIRGSELRDSKRTPYAWRTCPGNRPGAWNWRQYPTRTSWC